MEAQIGVIIEQGPADWQIVQQDECGKGRIELGGKWKFETPGQVEVRLVWEDTGVAVAAGLDWQAVPTEENGTWAGGLYRLETRLRTAENLAGEWSPRGDMRHFLGIGDLWVIAGQTQDHRVELVLERPLQGVATARIRRPCQRIWSTFCRCWAFGAWRSSDNCVLTEWVRA